MLHCSFLCIKVVLFFLFSFLDKCRVEIICWLTSKKKKKIVINPMVFQVLNHFVKIKNTQLDHMNN